MYHEKIIYNGDAVQEFVNPISTKGRTANLTKLEQNYGLHLNPQRESTYRNRIRVFARKTD